MAHRIAGPIVLAIILLTAAAASADDAGFELNDVGFATPESVLHDVEDDVYLVSNINGNPVAKDGNGFISKVSPAGKVLVLKWIDGARPGVELSAPKGMAIVGEALYVTDIDVVRVFDRTTGAPRAAIPIKGATFLNDLAAASTGVVYVSDMGVTVGPDGFSPTGSDAIWSIRRDTPTLLIQGKDLGKPNGLVVVGTDQLIVATFGSGEVYEIRQGARTDVRPSPEGAGSLDGIVLTPPSAYLVSSWEARAIYRLTGKTWTVVATDIDAPADIGWDGKRNRILVPKFNDDAVLVVPLTR
jgi:hypothetical protein